MDDIWALIGLSSLVAAIVTATLGLIRDVLVNRYNFKKTNEASYLENQVKLYYQIYFTVARIGKGQWHPSFFGKTEESLKEINTIVEENSHLLTPNMLNMWLDIMCTFGELKEESEPEKRRTIALRAVKQLDEILIETARTANEDILPRYRKIVGFSVGQMLQKIPKTKST